MELSDKVALILSKYGFSPAEGVELFAQLVNSKTDDLFLVDVEKDCVLCLDIIHDDENNWLVNMRVWTDYSHDFCLSYPLAGAIAMLDRYLVYDEEEKTRLLEFFRLCHKAHRENTKMPKFNPDLKGIFNRADLNIYVNSDYYEVSESTQITVSVDKNE